VLAQLRSALTYANVTATVAVFVALGGSSYAAIKVTGQDVRNSSLTGKDIKDNSVTGKDVKGLKSADVTDGALLARDFGSGQLPAGAPGPQGPPGPKGDSGSSDVPGATNVVVRVGPPVTIGPGSVGSANVSCEAGERAVGGGVSPRFGTFSGEDSTGGRTIASVPLEGNTLAEDGDIPDGWHGFVFNGSASNLVQVARVICASP
jgi:hypothetical protein